MSKRKSNQFTTTFTDKLVGVVDEAVNGTVEHCVDYACLLALCSHYPVNFAVNYYERRLRQYAKSYYLMAEVIVSTLRLGRDASPYSVRSSAGMDGRGVPAEPWGSRLLTQRMS
jgi:hypothetical protein